MDISNIHFATVSLKLKKGIILQDKFTPVK